MPGSPIAGEGQRRTAPGRPDLARHDPRRAKVHRSYSIAEAALRFGVHRNTVRHWIKGGLPTVRCGRLVLILGRHLRPFLAERQASRRRACGTGQMFCLRCREPRSALSGTVRAVAAMATSVNLAGRCAVCDARMHRRVRISDLQAAGFEVRTRQGEEDIADSAPAPLNCHLDRD